MRRLPIYGLDIETDTTVDGLDPSVSRIVAVALSTGGVDELFDGPEDELLAGLDERLGELPPGVLATWNGSAFDLPFIADRAARWRLRLGLQLVADPRIRHRHEPLPADRLDRRAVGTAAATPPRTQPVPGAPWRRRPAR